MVSVTTALFLSVGLQPPSETLAFGKWEKLTSRESWYKNKSAEAKGEMETVISDSYTFIANTLTPMSDQNRVSPYNINTILSRKVMRIYQNIKK